MRTANRWAAFACAMTLLGGCGVPAEDSARAIDPPRTFGPISPTPAVTASGAVMEKVYLVRDEMLVAVERKLPREPDVERVLADLLAGPTEAERAAGFTSALLGNNVVTAVQVTGGEATVALSSNLDGTGRNDDVLAFAQLVCTLDNRADISSVVFIRDGHRIGVPRADGSLTQDPLTLADYQSLIASR